jgi:hypothetical protein
MLRAPISNPQDLPFVERPAFTGREAIAELKSGALGRRLITWAELAAAEHRLEHSEHAPASSAIARISSLDSGPERAA